MKKEWQAGKERLDSRAPQDDKVVLVQQVRLDHRALLDTAVIPASPADLVFIRLVHCFITSLTARIAEHYLSISHQEHES